jgi:hypothetical protein
METDAGAFARRRRRAAKRRRAPDAEFPEANARVSIEIWLPPELATQVEAMAEKARADYQRGAEAPGDE